MKALFFWAGGEIQNLFINCIKSFPKNGFETILYSPQPEINKKYFGDEIDLRQSDEILPIQILYKFKQRKNRNKPCYSAFSDLFRAKLMQAHPGSWYFDTDILCLRNVDAFQELINHSNGKLIVGKQDDKSVNGAVLSGSSKKVINHYVNEIFEYVEKKNYIHDFGDFGPAFLNNYLRRYPENVWQVDKHIFYPIHYSDTNFFYDPDFREYAKEKLDDSLCVHIWNECLTMGSIPTNCPPPKSSLLYELIERILDFDNSYALPEDTMRKLFYPQPWGFKKTIKNILPSLLNYLKRKFRR